MRASVGLFVSRGAGRSRAPIDCEPYLDFIGRVALIALEGRFSHGALGMVCFSYANREFSTHMASLYGDDVEVIKPLMALGYKVNAFEDEAGEQPLHSAVIYGPAGHRSRAYQRRGGPRGPDGGWSYAAPLRRTSWERESHQTPTRRRSGNDIAHNELDVPRMTAPLNTAMLVLESPRPPRRDHEQRRSCCLAAAARPPG